MLFHEEGYLFSFHAASARPHYQGFPILFFRVPAAHENESVAFFAGRMPAKNATL